MEKVLWERKEIGVKMLELNIQLTHSDLPNLAKLRERIVNTQILDRIDIWEKIEVLEAHLMSKLSELEFFQMKVQYSILFMIMKDLAIYRPWWHRY